MLRNITRKLTIRLIILNTIQSIDDIKLIDKFLMCRNYTNFFGKVYLLKIYGSL
jgi:hypothetical protein